MNEEHNGKRRIIIRRSRNNGEGGSTGTGTATGSSTGADSTGTVGGGNGNDTLSDTEPANESPADDRSESEGMYRPTGTESERTGDNGSGGSDKRDTDTGDFLNFGTDTDSSGSASGSGRGAQGKPKRTYRKRQTSKVSLSVEQDTEDVKNIVLAIGDASANATGYDGFRVVDVEALTIARPAARILQRHGAIAETIRTVADPLSLLIATASVFGPRIAAYKMYKDMGAVPQQERTYTAPPAPDNAATVQPNTTEEKFARVDETLFKQFQTEN